MKLSYFLVPFALLTIPSLAQAETSWVAVDEVDAFTDETVKAVVYEDDSHRIQVSIETDESIAMYVELKRDTFEPNSTLELRVDSNPFMLFEPSSEMMNEVMIEVMGMQPYRWTPQTLVLFFASIDAINPTAATDIENAKSSCGNYMAQFLNGENLIGRYYVSDTQRETFSIPLDGFHEAANQVFVIADMHNDNPHCLR